ncbi:MAG: hypothetical protein AB8B53_04445 [Flavobacteriales bacterium]
MINYPNRIQQLVLFLVSLTAIGCGVLNSVATRNKPLNTVRVESSVFIPDSLFRNTSLPWDSIEGKWGIEVPPSYYRHGFGVWYEFSKKGDKQFLWQRSYKRPLDSTGYEAPIYDLRPSPEITTKTANELDSTIQKHELEKIGGLIYYGNQRITMAHHDSCVIENAIIPRGTNEWIYANDQITFWYQFQSDPRTSHEGTAIVWRDYATYKQTFKDTVSFTVLPHAKGKQIRFSASSTKMSTYPLMGLYLLDEFKSIDLAAFSPNIKGFVFTKSGHYTESYD